MGSKHKPMESEDSNTREELKCTCHHVCPVDHESKKFELIKQELVRTRQLYNDPDFPAERSSLGSEAFVSTMEARTGGRIECKRPLEIMKDAKFYIDGSSRFDIVQGFIGNCWFCAAAAVLASRDELLDRVIPKGQGFKENYAGIFHFRFWQYGKWISIIVDDRLPVKRDGTLLFMKSSRRNEFWSALLEKAYAKLHGSYEAIEGGFVSTAVDDLTGGLSESFNLPDLEHTERKIFKRMLQAHKCGSLIGCGAMVDKSERGIPGRHAYSVTDVKNIEVNLPQGMGKMQMVRVRNPHGYRGLEWKGAWRDDDPVWKYVSKDVKKTLNLKDEDDGEYWMNIKDFYNNFSLVELTHLNPGDNIDPFTENKWNMTEFHGSWIPYVTAGGCSIYQDTFHTNPQYRVSVEEPDDVDNDDDDDDDDDDADESDDGSHKCTVIISLMQKNRRQDFGGQRLTIGFSIFEVSDAENAQRTFDKSFFAGKGFGKLGQSPYTRSRSSTHRFQLAPGNYCVVPTTLGPREEGDFLLRIFTEKHHEAHE